MITCEDGTYDYVNAEVETGGIALSYKASELDIEGGDFIDDPSAMGWSESDVRRVVAEYLGITGGVNQIDVTF